jgi:hypothetical protein
MPENHYVQIIHGTWNPPSTQEPRWHQSSSTDPNNFAARLDALFGQYGMSGAVWRKWQEGEASFAWSGANQHADRIEAGDRLFQTWLDLLEHDPAARIHIVAHSHGANVTLRALERYLEYLSSQAARVFNRVLNACLHAEPSKAITIALAEMFGEHATVIHDQSRNSLDELQKLGSYLHRSGRNLKRKEWHRIDRGDSVWFDHFPEHVTTLRRSTWLQFRKAWVGSRGTNRIGALVFLGAPFFRKVWKLTTWWSPANVVRIIVDAIVSVFLGVSFAYVVETVLFSVLWLLLSPFTFIFGYGSFYHPGVNPFEWPPLLQVVVGGFAFLFTWGFFLECLKRTHRAINLYFDEERLGRSPIDGDNVPFDTLVIHAEMLDEVVLGFSAEPLVYGALRPQIHTVLYGRALFNWPRFPSGYEAHAWDWISAYLGSMGSSRPHSYAIPAGCLDLGTVYSEKAHTTDFVSNIRPAS